MRPLDPTLAAMLLDLLADEFGAQHQYRLHATIASRLKLTKLEAIQHEHYDDEVKHSGMLIDFLFTAGVDLDGQQGLCTPACDPMAGMTADYNGEMTAELKYIKAIIQAVKVGDQTVVAILQDILKDERDHIDDFFGLEYDRSIMGEANFLASLV